MDFSGVTDAQILVNKLMKNELQLQTSFRALLQSLSKVVDDVTCYYRLAKGKFPHLNKIYLCASQLRKVVESLSGTLHFYDNYAPHKENSLLVLERIDWCLKEITRISHGRGNDDDLEPREKFVDLIDSIINAIQCGKFDSVGSSINDLVQEALIIANFSASEDKEEITASCKNVLAYSSYGKDCVSSSNSIFGPELVLRALENLEHRVNTSMLRLCLHIFADSHSHYKKISVKCLGKKQQERSIEDLEEDFEALDFFCDKIQLIGRFALACSADRTAKLKIQCSLASIEFCGNQFERAATACYIQPQTGNNRLLKLIVLEYLTEVKSLQTQMNRIIDTPTFMQVIFDDLKSLFLLMKKEGASHNLHDCVKVFSNRCYVAVTHLRVTDDALVQLPQVKGAIKEFEEAVKFYVTNHQGVTQIPKTSSWNPHSWAEWILRSLDKLCQVLDHGQDSTLTNTTSVYKMGTPFCKVKNDCRINHFQSNALPDMFDDKDISSALLTPFLNKIKETPRVHSVLYGTTPKKLWRKNDGTVQRSKYEPRALLMPEPHRSAESSLVLDEVDPEEVANVNAGDFDVFGSDDVKKAAEEVLLLGFTSTNLTSSSA